jgi:hypothetical protein
VNDSDIKFPNEVAACWQVLTPLAEKASRILAQGSAYKRQMDRLNELRERAKAMIRNPKKEGEHRLGLLDKANKLATRAAPPRYPDVMDLLKHLRTVLPESKVDELERQIDFTFPGSICSVIIQAKEELQRHAGGALPGNSPAPVDKMSRPVTEGEIDTLEGQVQEMENYFREIDDAERKRSEEEQATARQRSEDQKLGVVELALKLQSENVEDKEIRTRVFARMRFEKPKAEPRELSRWWRDGVARELRRHKPLKKNKKS